MIDLFAFEELHRIEQRQRADRHLRRARWQEREPRRAPADRIGAARRRLARALLALADRLDPRAVVRPPHVPAAPSLNGTLHHA